MQRQSFPSLWITLCFLSWTKGPPAEIDPIVKGCAFVKHVRDDAATLTEPEWYAMLGIVGRCDNGHELAHEWSRAYPGYDVAETDAKLDRALREGGPRTCEAIERDFGSSCCELCPSRGKIKSPIALGNARRKQEEDGDPARKSQATELVELALAKGIDLFHSADGKAYATVPLDSGFDTFSVRSRQLESLISREFYALKGKTPSSQSIKDAIGTLEGRALYDGEEREVAVRLAEHEGSIYLDLANSDREVVEIDADGWRIVDDPPVRFLRRRGSLAVPRPVEGGRIEDIFQFVNIARAEDQNLFVAWLAAAMRPRGPFPVLVLNGEQGSAKSTACRFVRRLIDPNKAAVRRPPRDTRDLAIAASNAWIVAFGNLTRIPEWLSNDLCALATGGGFATRELYSDDEEALFDSMRPLILEGIPDFSKAPDLIDRSLRIVLDPIPDGARRDEQDLHAAFEAALPGILGALLDAVSGGLRRFATTRPKELPRMADFARWVVACEPDLPWDDGQFLSAYRHARRAARESVVEDSPVGGALAELLDQRRQGEAPTAEWTGTLADLLEALNGVREDTQLSPWPRGSRSLSGVLRTIAPALRSIGIEIHDAGKDGTTRRKRLRILRSFESGSPAKDQAKDRRMPQDDSSVDSSPLDPQQIGLSEASKKVKDPLRTPPSALESGGADGAMWEPSHDIDRIQGEL